jgi:putative resolvase
MTDDNEHWVSTGKASNFYGISPSTIRRWAKDNSVIYKRNPSGNRVFLIPKTNTIPNITTKHKSTSYVYARVSSYKQKDDLERQCNLLSFKFPNHTIIKDIGSGLNYKRRGLLKLLKQSNK